jgi:predicted RNase H-like HicB family nuclease
MQLQLTAVFRKVPDGYVAFVEELPGANTQGAALEEAGVNVGETAHLVLEANRALAEDFAPEGARSSRASGAAGVNPAARSPICQRS